MKKSMLESVVDAVLLDESKSINEEQRQDLYLYYIDFDGSEYYQESDYNTLSNMITFASDAVKIGDAAGFVIKSSETDGDEDVLFTS